MLEEAILAPANQTTRPFTHDGCVQFQGTVTLSSIKAGCVAFSALRWSNRTNLGRIQRVQMENKSEKPVFATVEQKKKKVLAEAASLRFSRLSTLQSLQQRCLIEPACNSRKCTGFHKLPGPGGVTREHKRPQREGEKTTGYKKRLLA